MKNSKKALLYVLIAIACAVAVVGFRAYFAVRDPSRAFGSRNTPAPRSAAYYADDADIQEPNPQSTPVETPLQTPVETPPPSFEQTNERVIITLLGLDSNAEREAQSMGKRSDTIALVSVDMATGACSVLSVPRDTRAKIRRLNKKGEVTSTRWDKINAAYAYGGGDDANSAQNSLFALSQLLATELYYYATIDMDSIAPIVEAVGGVAVTLENDIKDVGKEGETVTLDGDSAYVFLRRRKGIDDGSDVARTARQRQFMKALAKRLQELDPVAAFPSLWGAVAGNVQTNLSFEQMVALVSVLKGMNVEDVSFSVLPGKPRSIKGKSFYIMDEAETEEIIGAAF